MKPSNFPGRKNKRRVVALRNVQDPDEREIIAARIIDDTTARQLRSKKHRGLYGR